MTSLQNDGDTHSSNMINVKVYDVHGEQLVNCSHAHTYNYLCFQHTHWNAETICPLATALRSLMHRLQ